MKIKYSWYVSFANFVASTNRTLKSLKTLVKWKEKFFFDAARTFLKAVAVLMKFKVILSCCSEFERKAKI